MDRNQLLADSRGIPWNLPHDVAHFRECARGKWLLLGRKTFGEMRGWFEAGSVPLVLSSTCGWDPDIGRVVASVPQALAMAEAAAQAQLVCCGGARTYAAALPYADRMVLTLIEHAYAADDSAVYFPKWRAAEWRTVSESVLPRDRQEEPPARVLTLERVS